MEKLLSNLKKVRRSSNDSWMACCPAHEDRSPSLSLKDAGGGRILINCLAGCATEDVLAAIGMGWDDVMPEKATHHRAKPTKNRVYATDALIAIQFEARIVMLAAWRLAKGGVLTEDDMKRLELAVERINTACGMANV